jgi:hypothetical protein
MSQSRNFSCTHAPKVRLGNDESIVEALVFFTWSTADCSEIFSPAHNPGQPSSNTAANQLFLTSFTGDIVMVDFMRRQRIFELSAHLIRLGLSPP